MRKTLRLSSITLQKKVSVISCIAEIPLSESECSVLAEIIELSVNNQIMMTPQTTAHIREKLSITKSGFGTSLHRLLAKQAINKKGKNIMLHPVYKDINLMTELLIKLVD